MHRATIAALTLALLGCAPALSTPKTVSLRMNGGPPTALVTIDDEVVGTLAEVIRRGVALPKGPHRITVEAPGFFPLDRLVEASTGPVLVEAVLEPIPD